MTIGVWLYYHPEIVQGIHLALIGIGVAIVCCAMIWRFFMQKKPVIICRDEVVLICCTVILALSSGCILWIRSSHYLLTELGMLELAFVHGIIVSMVLGACLALRTRKGIACWLFIAIAATLQILGCLFPTL